MRWLVIEGLDPFIALAAGGQRLYPRGTSQFPVVRLLPIVYTKRIESTSLLASHVLSSAPIVFPGNPSSTSRKLNAQTNLRLTLRP